MVKSVGTQTGQMCICIMCMCKWMREYKSHLIVTMVTWEFFFLFFFFLVNVIPLSSLRTTGDLWPIYDHLCVVWMIKAQNSHLSAIIMVFWSYDECSVETQSSYNLFFFFFSTKWTKWTMTALIQQRDFVTFFITTFQTNKTYCFPVYLLFATLLPIVKWHSRLSVFFIQKLFE